MSSIAPKHNLTPSALLASSLDTLNSLIASASPVKNAAHSSGSEVSGIYLFAFPIVLHLFNPDLQVMTQDLQLDRSQPVITVLSGPYPSQLMVNSQGETGLITTVMVSLVLHG